MKRPFGLVIGAAAGALLVAAVGASAHSGLSLTRWTGVHSALSSDEASPAREHSPEPAEIPEAPPTAAPTEAPRPAETETETDADIDTDIDTDTDTDTETNDEVEVSASLTTSVKSETSAAKKAESSNSHPESKEAHGGGSGH